MLHPVTYRTLALAVGGLLLACNALALTLGQPRGTLLIGRPLEVSLPVTLDAPDPEGACSTAEVFYGETPLLSRPEIRWQPGPDGVQGVLRIMSPEAVNEPTVTLNLRIGCGASQATRRYVLLPDVPRAADLASVNPGQRPAVRPPALGPAARAQSQAAAPERATAPPQGVDLPRVPSQPRPARGDSRRPARAAAPASASAPETDRAPAAAPARRTGSRLRLAPLEIGPEPDAILHFETELTLPGPGDADKRAAAVALWQALNKTPEEAVQDGIKLRALDREIQSLRQLTQQNAAAVTAMREQVDKARGSRDDVSLLALLLGAILLAIGGWAGWRWYQSHRLDGVSRWFDANQPEAGDSMVPVTTPPPNAAGAAGVAAAPARKPARRGDAVHPHLQTAPLDVAAARAAVSGWAPSDFQTSQGGTPRMVGVRELLDVHDKADFFLSIGQHDQAIAVLEAHVHDQVETSALPWLDLLELYHSQGRRQEFEARRAEFRQRFTAQVPDFDHFDEPSGSLENYSRALSRIVALWPSRRVLEVIEESIFRKPGLAGADTFSLEAYRELVLLYHIAQEVAPREDTLPTRRERPTGFSSTSMQSLSELDRPEIDLDVPLDLDDLGPGAHGEMTGSLSEGTLAWGDPNAADSSQHTADRDPLYIPPASPRLGLDIDLGDLDAAAPGDFEPSRNLPPLDFDTSEFDPDVDRKPPGRRG